VDIWTGPLPRTHRRRHPRGGATPGRRRGRDAAGTRNAVRMWPRRRAYWGRVPVRTAAAAAVAAAGPPRVERPGAVRTARRQRPHRPPRHPAAARPRLPRARRARRGRRVRAGGRDGDAAAAARRRGGRAIAVGLRTAAGTGAGGAVEGLGEAAVRAPAKLEQVLRARLRRRVGALHAATTPLNGPPAGPRADPRTLTVLAAACRDREVLRFTYRGGDGRETRRAAEPHGLVPAAHRWYLVAYDTGGRAGPGSGSRGGTGDGGGGWRSFRVDRLTCPRPTGVRFTPREVPGGDPAAFVA